MVIESSQINLQFLILFKKIIVQSTIIMMTIRNKQASLNFFLDLCKWEQFKTRYSRFNFSVQSSILEGRKHVCLFLLLSSGVFQHCFFLVVGFSLSRFRDIYIEADPFKKSILLQYIFCALHSSWFFKSLNNDKSQTEAPL